MKRDTNNAISLYDAIEDVSPVGELPEHGVPAVEVRLWRMGHEKLAAAGIRPRQRHAQRAAKVSVAIELVTNGVSRATVAIAARIASLNV